MNWELKPIYQRIEQLESKVSELQVRLTELAQATEKLAYNILRTAEKIESVRKDA